ncbi:hypothetical protein [Blastomonas sp. UPD001]|uniref:hypothetical protein n=1 Tax=Blastomonas sp. UPD001 TaxID=2217673 RepID=UPI000E34AD65|nr:hypothetical protein [Blastomonas sp. UPD001]
MCGIVGILARQIENDAVTPCLLRGDQVGAEVHDGDDFPYAFGHVEAPPERTGHEEILRPSVKQELERGNDDQSDTQRVQCNLITEYPPDRTAQKHDHSADRTRIDRDDGTDGNQRNIDRKQRAYREVCSPQIEQRQRRGKNPQIVGMRENPAKTLAVDLLDAIGQILLIIILRQAWEDDESDQRQAEQCGIPAHGPVEFRKGKVDGDQRNQHIGQTEYQVFYGGLFGGKQRDEQRYRAGSDAEGKSE